jgi:hypothetical protein
MVNGQSVVRSSSSPSPTITKRRATSWPFIKGKGDGWTVEYQPGERDVVDHAAQCVALGE